MVVIDPTLNCCTVRPNEMCVVELVWDDVSCDTGTSKNKKTQLEQRKHDQDALPGTLD